jgi:nitrogen regulatory protein P-II 1
MKEIKAIVRPARMNDLRRALLELPGFPGMSVASCRGVTAPALKTPGGFREELVDYTDKLRIDIVAEDAMVEPIVEAIRKVATTGRLGDGILWVTPVDYWERLASAGR